MRSRPIEDFWISADGDDWSLAFTRAQTAMSQHDTLEILVENRQYNFNSQLDVFRKIGIVGPEGGGFKLTGTGAASTGYAVSSFHFSNNTPGIVVHYPTTRFNTGTYTTDPTADSYKPYFRNLALIGTSQTTGSSANHGLVCHRSITLENFSVQKFSGNAIQVLATSGSSSSVSYGNANTCYISKGYVNSIGGSGLVFNGGDSNTAVVTTVSINDCGRNTSISAVATTSAIIVEDNQSVTGTPSTGVGTVTATVGAGHNYTTGMYAELTQTDNTAVLTTDTDGDGTLDYADPVLIWVAGQVTVSGNNLTWSYSGTAPTAGTYKVRTGAGANSVTGSDTTEGEGRVFWGVVAAGTPTLSEGQTVRLNNYTLILSTELTTVHKAYNGLIGVICPDMTYSSGTTKDPDLKGTLADGVGNITPLAAQLYSSNFLANVYTNVLCGPTVQSGGYQYYDDSGYSTFLSCYCEGSSSASNYFNGTGVAIGGNLPQSTTTQSGLTFLRGDGLGKLRVTRGLEIFPEYYDSGWKVLLGGETAVPDAGKVLAVRHSSTNHTGSQPSFLGIEYNLSHGKVAGYLDWSVSASAGDCVMLIPHNGNKRTAGWVAFPGGMQLACPSDDNSWANPGNPVRNPADFGYIGFDKVSSNTYAAYFFGTGRNGSISSITNNAGSFQINTLAGDNYLTTAKSGLRHIITNVSGTANANGHWISTSNGTATQLDISEAFAGTYSTYTATLSTIDNSTYADQGYSTVVVTSPSGSLAVGDRLNVGIVDAQKDLRVRSVSGNTITVYGNLTVSSNTTILKSNGYVMQAQAMGWHTAAPTAGKWSRGDIMWNFDPGTSGILGWSCTTGSEAGGTWKILTVDQAVTLDSSAELGTVKVLQKTFTALTTGSADDVTILDGTPGLPYACKVIDVQLFVTTEVGGSTCTLNTATGGGAAISSDMSSNAKGHVRDAGIASGAVAVLAAGDDLYLRRSDRAVAGTVYVYLMIT